MTKITVAYGDGIGPEIMDAVLFILKEAGAKLQIITIEVGEKIYKQGYTSGLSDSTIKTILENKILLKAPITTPQGGGYKSLNVTIRKLLGLYANVRPTKALHPFVKTYYPKMDLIIVRENEEDLYSGVEYRQTHNMYAAAKFITRTGCEKVIRFAFDYASRQGRKKVTCLTKDNIMKFTDGLFHKVFDETAGFYPEIESEHYIIDIGAAKIATCPEQFDVIVTENLYGDIISDIAAEVGGSVGMSGSANIGSEYAMFEAIHGSAPSIAGQGIANPSGLLNAATMMLTHIEQHHIANAIENAWLATLEDGIHTEDIYQEKLSVKKVSTREFAEAVVERLGQKPKKLTAAAPYIKSQIKSLKFDCVIKYEEKKQLVGVDIYINYMGEVPAAIAAKINQLTDRGLSLQLISSRGLKVWPHDMKIVADITSDHWRLRFVPNTPQKIIDHKEITYLLNKLIEAQIDFIKIENLYTFDGELGFSLAQGQ